ncbi:MAG: redox-regulated ATPase YchF [Candidatus Colwellbacteria bacterium CG10_big_fil_rev_8_21_14_0_10_41_28]|uniref:Redox-regulated ATPase YchF n=1 Tax=Candidatus Colwellbacteria bacterium CG10_big_fil_rev_8_21_14_0_10_41_28 TaxID=1974539 RepID=A0A2H0VHX4_9BACT|nr:MAG: redox-regulated ATPase YchF [Candidatus Colwellbacteria bacterium CG10_big_fil_rev_8_21_14_0_10_41_28]
MSKLSVGIVGLPNVGKSTLFNALTKQQVVAANYPFATIDPNVGVVSVPDERLDKLAELSSSENKIPAVVEFYDIAGLVKGANKGEGLGNQFLAHIREVKIIVHVVRVFKLDGVIHVEGSIDGLRDFETINTELILKDMELLDKRIDRAMKESKTGDKSKKEELTVLEKVKAALDEGQLAHTLGEEILGKEVVSELSLLTSKPQLILLNGDESEVGDNLKKAIEELGFQYMVADLGQDASLGRLIKSAYKSLDLITFFTTGPKETRGWTLREGGRAPQAGGVIHSDFEDKFIRAEVVLYDKLVEAGSWVKAKEKGWMRIEGKQYVIQDGDVLIIHHS